MIAYLSITPSGQAVQTLHVTANRGLVSAHGLSGPTQVRGETWSRPEEWGVVEVPQFMSARIATLEGWIVQPTLDAMWADWRSLAAAFHYCLSADAVLKFQEGTGGPQLQGNVRLAGDVLPPIEGSYGVLRYMVQLRAADPFWYSQTLNSTGALPFVNPGGIPFPIPFPIPFGQTPSVPGAVAGVVNGGSVPSWPTVTVTGPANGVLFENFAEGTGVSLPTLNLTAGQTLTIDCKAKSVTVGGSSVAGSIDFLRSSFPRLLVGLNSLRVSAAASTGSTTATIAWRDGYL